MSTQNFDNDIPKIVLEKEDREAFQRNRKQTGKPPPSAAAEESGTKSSGVSGGWVFLIFLIAAGAAGANFWLYTQKLEQDKVLLDAQNRIVDLERRLSATGEEMDQSAVALQVKVNELVEKTDELWKQMDKLWASAWRRNQADIKELDGKLSRADDSLEKQLSVVEEESGLTSTSLAVLQEQLDSQVSKAQQLTAQLSKSEKADSDLKRLLGDVQAKLIATDQVSSALTRRIAELEKWKSQAPAQVSQPRPATPVTSAGTP